MNSKFTYSKTKNESYLSYLLMEMIVIAIITLIGVGFCLFYIISFIDKKVNTNLTDLLIDEAAVFGGICVSSSILAVLFLLYYRNRNYIVGYQFHEEQQTVTLAYRNLTKKIHEQTVSYHSVVLFPIKESKFLFNHPYKGTRVKELKKKLTIDFISNNFIWEKQVPEKRFFLQHLKNEVRKLKEDSLILEILKDVKIGNGRA